MRKGISPIVAVVLLIAIAVIAAVGLYFWVGGLATQQPTPSKPVVISAQRVTCSTSGANDSIIVMLQNLDPANSIASSSLSINDDNGMLINTSNVGSSTVGAGAQAALNFSATKTAAALTTGNTYVVYGTSGIGQAQVVC